MPNGKNQPRQNPKGKIIRMDVTTFTTMESTIIVVIILGTITFKVKIREAANTG
jgi:cell division protein FtsL